MAASGIITPDGRYTAVPGVYSSTNASAAAAVGPSPRGTVAIIGEMRKAAPQEIHDVGSPSALRDLVDSCVVRDAGEIAFDPDLDANIHGASALKVIGVNPSVAASATFANASGNALTLTSLIYGLKGNRISVEIAAGTTKGKKFTIVLDGNTYTYDDLGGDEVLKLRYAPAGDATVMQATITTGTSLVIDYETDQAGNAVYTPSGMVFDGTLTFDCDEAQIEKLIALVSELMIDYEAHRILVAGGVHGAADAANTLASIVAPTNLAECQTRLNDLKAKYNLHHVYVVGACHGGAGDPNAVTAAAASDLDTSITLANDIRAMYELHRVNVTACHGIVDSANPVTLGATTKTVDVVITGTYQGSPQSETLTLTNPNVVTTTSVNSYDSITNIDMTDVMATTTVTISGIAMTALFADHETISNVVDYVNSRGSTQGFVASSGIGNASTFESDDLDTCTATSIRSAVDVAFYADLALIEDAIDAQSDLVSATIVTPGIGAPNNTATPTYLSGGLNGSAGSSDWQTCLDLLIGETVQCSVMMTADPAIIDLGRAHVDAQDNISERFLFYGTASLATKATAKAAPLASNSRFVGGVCFQDVQMYLNGVQQWVAPMYQAAMVAGMFAGRPVGHPLLWKKPRATNYRQHSGIDIVTQSGRTEMIQAGCIYFVRDDDTQLIKIERDVTTYLSDENPFFTSLSASESEAESKKDMRRALKIFVGQPNYSGTEADVKAEAAERLRRQADRNDLALIKAWDPTTLTVTDLGDRYKVVAGICPLEATTFIIYEDFISRVYDV